MKVYQIPVGPMQNFSYIVEDTSTHEAIVIDPSWDLEKLTKTIDEQNLKIKYIVNTHWQLTLTGTMIIPEGTKNCQNNLV